MLSRGPSRCSHFREHSRVNGKKTGKKRDWKRGARGYLETGAGLSQGCRGAAASAAVAVALSPPRRRRSAFPYVIFLGFLRDGNDDKRAVDRRERYIAEGWARWAVGQGRRDLNARSSTDATEEWSVGRGAFSFPPFRRGRQPRSSAKSTWFLNILFTLYRPRTRSIINCCSSEPGTPARALRFEFASPTRPRIFGSGK